MTQALGLLELISCPVFFSVQLLSRVLTLCDTTDCKMPGFPVHHQLPELAQTQCPLNLLYYLKISSSASFFSSLPQSFPALVSFPINQLFTSSDQSICSFSFSISSSSEYPRFLSFWLLWSPWSPKDSQESFPAPQCESINALAPMLFYGPSVTSVQDYWKDNSFDYMDLCWQSDVSAF